MCISISVGEGRQTVAGADQRVRATATIMGETLATAPKERT